MPRRVARTLSTDDDKPEPPHLTLPAAQRRQLAARVQESVRGVVASMLSSGDTSKAVWQPKLRRGGVSYYVDTTTVRAGQTRFCCVSHTAAPVEEMLQLFRLTDTKSLLRNNRILYNNVLDARVLAVLERPTLTHPLRSMYVRYSCFQTPGPMANRDMCVAVATDVFTDPEDGATIGYCLWDSVGDEEPFSSVAHTPGLVPCVMFRSGFFFRRAAPGADAIDDPAAGQTKVVYILGMEPGGFAPGLTTRLLMVKFGANLLRLCAHFRRKRLDSSRFVLKSQWPSKSTARVCRRCSKSFTMLSVRVNCHACGQVVCKTCTSKETVELQAVGFVPMRICLGCLEVSGLPAPPTPLRSTMGSRRGRERLEMGDTLSSRSADYSTVETTLMSSSRSAVDWHDGDAEEWEMTPTGNVRHYRFE